MGLKIEKKVIKKLARWPRQPRVYFLRLLTYITFSFNSQTCHLFAEMRAAV
jgi:hypothetical protein